MTERLPSLMTHCLRTKSSATVSVMMAFMLSLTLSACVTTPEGGATLAPLRAAKPASQSPEANTENSITSAETLADDEMTAIPEDEELALVAVVPPAPEPEPELPPELDPASLVGSAADTLTKRLGSPTLRRREGSAEVWQYKMNACIVDFVLSDGVNVTAWQSRHRTRGVRIDNQLCRRNLATLAGL